MESIMSLAGEQFRNNMEDRSTTQARVMSTGEKTMEPLEAKKMELAERRRQRLERRRQLEERSRQCLERRRQHEERSRQCLERRRQLEEEKKQLEEEKKQLEGIIYKWKILEEREVESAAQHIKVETQELQQELNSHSDQQIRQTAEFVHKMSEEILDQKERLSGNKASVKDTCREVKIVLQQISDLAEDKWQSLSEEAKLTLDSMIKKFWKMTASMWKLIFCVLLLSELRDIFDILYPESCYISLSRGRLKYAFKMASMLALWLSHDVETNPGPQFNERTCVEMYVRRLSLALRDDLDTAGSIWSKKIAQAAYNAGFSRNLRWNNPSSGKNKDSLPKLKERAKELIRLLSARNCLPSDLPAFTDLDQQETLDGLRKYLEVKHFETAANVLLNEPGFTTSLKEKIRHLTGLAQEEISYSKQMIHNPPGRPLTVPDINEFQQLADPQCLNDSEGDGTTLRQNESSTDCPVSPRPLSTSMDTQRHEGDNRGLTNRVCTQSATTDTLQDEARRVAGTTGSDFACRTSHDNQDNIMTATPCTPETDVSHTFQADCYILREKNAVGETSIQFNSSHEEQRDVNILSDFCFAIPSVSPSDSDSFDRADGAEASHPITDASVNVHTPLINTRDITVPADTSDEALLADIEPLLLLYVSDAPTSPTDTCDMTDDVSRPTHTSDQDILSDLASGPSRVLNSNGVNTSLTDTCDITDDVSLPAHTPDEALMADIESGPSRVFNVDDVNTSLTDTCDKTLDISFPTHTPDEDILPDLESGPSRVFNVDDVNATLTDTCDITDDVSLPTHTPDEVILSDLTSGPSRVLNSNDVNTSHRYTPNADRSPHGETQSAVPAAYDGGCDDDARNASEPLQNVSPDNNQVDTVCEGVYETPEQACNTRGCQETYGTEACEATPETDTQTSGTTTETDTQACVTTAETDTQACVTTREIDTQVCVTTAETDTQTCVTTRETDTQVCVTTTAAETQTCVTTAEIGTQTYLETTETNTQTCVVTAEGDTQTYFVTADTDTQTSVTTAGTGQTPRSPGNSLHQVDSDECGMSPGRSCGTSRKRKHQLQHLPSKKRRI